MSLWGFSEERYRKQQPDDEEVLRELAHAERRLKRPVPTIFEPLEPLPRRERRPVIKLYPGGGPE